MRIRLHQTIFVGLFAIFVGCNPDSESYTPVHVDGLGTIAFPNSGSEKAQDPFIRGVLLLHSFEFGPSADAFREAQSIDPGFAMAYWGEAMTYNHPLWRQVDLEAGRETLKRLAAKREKRTIKLSEREQMYLDAVSKIYDSGEKAERDSTYMEAMSRIHATFPRDDEATTFYALSILGSTNGERDLELYARAADIVRPVFARNPDHPGAAHYIIHSSDDPLNAEKGLSAANAYSAIAPDAAHAQHMTTHIFTAIGSWDRVVENNIRAMDVQNAARLAAGSEPNHCGHYSSWRHYAHLQLSQFEDAESLMDACYNSVVDGARRGEWGYFASMRALHIIDTQDWSLADRWVVLPPDFDYTGAAPGTAQSITTYLFSNALAAVRSGDSRKAREILDQMPGELGGDNILRSEVEGLLEIADGRVDEGIQILRDAANSEASYPFMFGPPNIVKPTFELLGEELLRAGRTEQAAAAFETALERTPGRRASVEGAEAVAAGAKP